MTMTRVVSGKTLLYKITDSSSQPSGANPVVLAYGIGIITKTDIIKPVFAGFIPTNMYDISKILPDVSLKTYDLSGTLESKSGRIGWTGALYLQKFNSLTSESFIVRELLTLLNIHNPFREPNSDICIFMSSPVLMHKDKSWWGTSLKHIAFKCHVDRNGDLLPATLTAHHAYTYLGKRSFSRRIGGNISLSRAIRIIKASKRAFIFS